MASIIDDLERALISRWRAKSFVEWDFASIAATTLEEFDLHAHVERVPDHVFIDNEGLLLHDHVHPEIACLHQGG